MIADSDLDRIENRIRVFGPEEYKIIKRLISELRKHTQDKYYIMLERNQTIRGGDQFQYAPECPWSIIEGGHDGEQVSFGKYRRPRENEQL
jgi:hypothetical protein